MAFSPFWSATSASPGAAAITAVVFAAVTAALVAFVPKSAPKKAELVEARPKFDQNTMKLATEAGVALLGIVGDLTLTHRLRREDKALRTRAKLEALPPATLRQAKKDDALLRARRKEQKALKAKHKAEKKLRSARLRRITHP